MVIATPPHEIISPDSADAALAKRSGRSLATRLSRMETCLLEIRDGDTGETLELPASATRALLHVLTELGQGHAVQVTPIHAELSMQQAADILNVSRPFVIQLIESNQIACRMVGTHRRVLFKDVLDFKIRNKQARVKILGELVAEAQEFDMAY